VQRLDTQLTERHAEPSAPGERRAHTMKLYTPRLREIVTDSSVLQHLEEPIQFRRASGATTSSTANTP
jgi:hypothetical protein